MYKGDMWLTPSCSVSLTQKQKVFIPYAISGIELGCGFSWPLESQATNVSNEES